MVSYTTSLQGDLRHAGLPVRAYVLCPDVVATQMVTSHEHDPDAAILFAGPKPMPEERVADSAVRLLRSRQVLRVVPRWRGPVVRPAGLAPAAGLPLLALLRKRGARRQARL